MNQRWKVRRSRRPDGTLYRHAVAWEVFNPENAWQGTFETWAEAMTWATNPVERLEHWLANQPRPNIRKGYWGQPANRDDEGHLK